jgi:hypothetical protein
MDFTVYEVAVLPLVIALVKLAELLGVSKRYLPVISVMFGLLGGIFYLAAGDIKQGILLGLWLGLGAVGLHSGIKNTFESK